ncbi:MAG: hypothetical protein ACFB3T_05355 [Geminicoccaceae bacterium]
MPSNEPSKPKGRLLQERQILVRSENFNRYLTLTAADQVKWLVIGLLLVGWLGYATYHVFTPGGGRELNREALADQPAVDVTALENRIASLETRNATLQARLDEAVAAQSAVVENGGVDAEELVALREQVAAEQARVSEAQAETSGLRERLASLQSDRDALEARLKAGEEQTAALDAAQTRIAELERRLAELAGSESADEALASAQTRIAALETELDEAKEAARAQADAAYQAEADALADAEAHVARLEQENAVLQDQLASLEARLGDVQSDPAEETEAAQRGELPALREQVTALTADLAAANTERSEIRAHAERLESELKALTATPLADQVEALQQQLAQEAEAQDSLREALNAALEAADDLAVQLAQEAPRPLLKPES